MSESEDVWTVGDTIDLQQLGWTLYGDEERRQTPADLRPDVDAYLNTDGEMTVCEKDTRTAWVTSDTVMEVMD